MIAWPRICIVYEVCQKSSRTEWAVWATSGVGINGCVNVWRNIYWTYNCNFRSLKPLYTFSQARINSYLNFTCQAMTIEQCINLKFLVRWVKLHQMHSECCRKCTEMRWCHAHVSEWHMWFKEGRKEVEDDSRTGRPSMSRTANNVECMNQMVCGDCQLTVRMIARWAGNQLWQHMEEYHGRFGYMEDLCEDGAEAFGWWPGVACACGGVSGHSRTYPNWARLATESHHWWWVLDLYL